MTRPRPCGCTRAATLVENAAESHLRDAEHLEARPGVHKPLSPEPLNAVGHRAVHAALTGVARDITEGNHR